MRHRISIQPGDAIEVVLAETLPNGYVDEVGWGGEHPVTGPLAPLFAQVEKGLRNSRFNSDGSKSSVNTDALAALSAIERHVQQGSITDREASEKAERLRAWVGDLQLSNRIGVPHYPGPAELKQDIRDILDYLESVERHVQDMETALRESASLADSTRMGWADGLPRDVVIALHRISKSSRAALSAAPTATHQETK